MYLSRVDSNIRLTTFNLSVCDNRKNDSKESLASLIGAFARKKVGDGTRFSVFVKRGGV